MNEQTSVDLATMIAVASGSRGGRFGARTGDSLGRSEAAVIQTPPAFTPTVYVEDHFNNTGGSNVALVGWVPDTTGAVAWSKNTASPADNAQVSFSSDSVVATTSTGTYYVDKAVLPSTDYAVQGKLADTSGTFSGPGVFLGFSDTALTGYRFFRDGTTTNATYGMTLQQAVAGTFTSIGGMGPGVANWGTSGKNVRLSRYVMSDRVRIKMEDIDSGQTVVCDDTSGSKITGINYPGLGLRLTGGVDDIKVQNVQTQNRGGTELVSDGAYTWFNDPRSITYGGKTYIGHVRADGSICVSKLDSGVVTTFVLSSALEKDDHANPGLIVLPGGRIACFYSKHSSDTVGIRYRVSTNPLPDISAFNAEVQVANGGLETAYCKPYYTTNDGKIRVYFRSSVATTRPQKAASALATDIEAGTPTWSLSTVFQTTNARPYVLCVQNGANRIDFHITDGHPNETATSVYHCYMTIAAGGAEHYFKSDGTEILTGLPIDVSASLTQIDNTTGGRVWNWAIGIGGDGNPRVLFTKYPSSTGARDIIFTDVEYWHGRWNGSAWVKTRLATGQHSLYSSENHYTGGMCFDSADVTHICASEWNTTYNVNMLAEYSFDENAGTRSLVKYVSMDPSSHSLRPYSPLGHGADCKWIWFEGGYVTFGITSPTFSAVTGSTFYCFNTTVRYST